MSQRADGARGRLATVTASGPSRPARTARPARQIRIVMNRSSSRFAVLLAAGAMLVGTTPAVAGDFIEVEQVLPFSFPLSPGQQLLEFQPADEQGGALTLISAELMLTATATADVTFIDGSSEVQLSVQVP